LGTNLQELEEKIEQVDRFYSEQVKRLDDSYDQRIERVLEKTEMLEAALAQLSSRLGALERRTK